MSYAIALWVFTFLVYYIAAALVNDGINFILPYTENVLGWSRGSITTIVSISNIVAAAVTFFIFALAGRIGAAKVLIVILFIAGISAVVLSRSTEFGPFAFALALMTVGSLGGLMVLPGVLLAKWFVKNKGKVLGIVTIGAPLSTASFVLIMNTLNYAYSFEVAYTSAGIFIIIIAVFGLFAIVEKPEDVGLSPDGIKLSPDQVKEMKANMEDKAGMIPTKEILKKKESWMYVVAFGFCIFIMGGIMSQLVLRLMDVGFDLMRAVGFLSISALLAIPVSFAWGFADDRFGTRRVCIVFTLTFSIAALCLIFVAQDRTAITIIGMIGIASLAGGLPNLEPSFVASIFGRKNMSNVMRVLKPFVVLIGAFGVACAGLTYDRFGTYVPAYIIFIVMGIVASILIALAKGKYDDEAEKIKMLAEAQKNS